MPVPPKPDPVKFCEICRAQLFRKRFNGRLEDRGVFLRRRRCGQSCANTRLDGLTDDGYRSRARQHRRESCEDCSAAEKLHVHHLDRDITNNSPSNLRTLCDSCHLKTHWREDREKWLAARRRRPPQPCIICGGAFHPRNTRTQTCSPACKAVLLGQRQPVSASGYRGVYAKRGRWQARARHEGRWRSIGTFDTPQQAELALRILLARAFPVPAEAESAA